MTITEPRKRILYIDLDGTTVHFESGVDKLGPGVRAAFAGRLDEIPGVFAEMDPMPGALDAIAQLAERYDTYILSTAPWGNPSAWMDKLLWVQEHLGDQFTKRLILSHHKNLNAGDYLIDDRPNNGAAQFTGEWLHFGAGNAYPDWDAVLDRLL